MDPRQIDALLNVMGLAPSRWTLAAQVERDAAEEERRARWRKFRKGIGLRKAARLKGKRDAEKRRKRFVAANGAQGSHGPNGAGKGIEVRRKAARWAEQGKLDRFRALEQVQQDRAALWEMLKAEGGWLTQGAMVRIGAEQRWLEADLKWLVRVGAAEHRRADPLPGARSWGAGVSRQWQAIGEKAPRYEPGMRQAAMYRWQALGQALRD